MTPHQETLYLANSLPLWIFCILTVGLVFFQTIIFVLLGRKNAPYAGISRTDIRRSAKAGLISTVGPALSIFIVGLGLITQIGAPMTLSRLSVIGNATYEASAAEMAAAALGTSINSTDYSMIAFTCSVWVMNLGGICMILPSLLFLKPLSQITQSAGKKNGFGMVIGLSASLASFGYFSAEYSMRNTPSLTAVLSGFICMVILDTAAGKYHLSWLKEWALALSLLTSLAIVMILYPGGTPV